MELETDGVGEAVLMREFTSMASFAAYLGTLVVAEHEMNKAILSSAAKVVQKAAKDKIGQYQSEASPFLAWEPLAESTLEEKARLGYTGQVSEDDPLLRTGDMAASILWNADGREAYVGSDSEIAEFQELGTAKMPPRSFLGGAAVEKTPDVLKIVGVGATLFLSGGGVMGGKGLPINP